MIRLCTWTNFFLLLKQFLNSTDSNWDYPLSICSLLVCSCDDCSVVKTTALNQILYITLTLKKESNSNPILKYLTNTPWKNAPGANVWSLHLNPAPNQGVSYIWVPILYLWTQTTPTHYFLTPPLRARATCLPARSDRTCLEVFTMSCSWEHWLWRNDSRQVIPRSL